MEASEAKSDVRGKRTSSSRERKDLGAVLRSFSAVDGAPATFRFHDEEQRIFRRIIVVAVVGQAVIGAAGERDAVRPASRLALGRRATAGDLLLRLVLLQLRHQTAASVATASTCHDPRPRSRRGAGRNGSLSVPPVSSVGRRRRLDAGGPALARRRVARS